MFTSWYWYPLPLVSWHHRVRRVSIYFTHVIYHTFACRDRAPLVVFT